MNKHTITSIFFLLFISVYVSGCKEEDKCESVTCQNSGTCNEGLCTCTTGYEGAFCETQSSTKFIASYFVADACTTSMSYTSVITQSANAANEVVISKVKWENNIRATVTGNSITIVSPQVTTNGFLVSGNGTLSGTQILMSVTLTLQSNPNITQTCAQTFTKQ